MNLQTCRDISANRRKFINETFGIINDKDKCIIEMVCKTNEKISFYIFDLFFHEKSSTCYNASCIMQSATVHAISDFYENNKKKIENCIKIKKRY